MTVSWGTLLIISITRCEFCVGSYLRSATLSLKLRDTQATAAQPANRVHDGILMRHKKIVKQWVDAFNNADANSIAELYAEEAINHQVTSTPVEGKNAIKSMFASEFSQAEMTCIVDNIFEDGDWVILEWKDPLGLRGCGFFQFQNDKIIFQRGYWDKLSFLRMHHLPIPSE